MSGQRCSVGVDGRVPLGAGTCSGRVMMAVASACWQLQVGGAASRETASAIVFCAVAAFCIRLAMMTHAINSANPTRPSSPYNGTRMSSTPYSLIGTTRTVRPTFSSGCADADVRPITSISARASAIVTPE